MGEKRAVNHIEDIYSKSALILCAAPEWDSRLAVEQAEKADLVICADGGYLRAVSAGIVPNVLMGDFDSCGIEQVQDLDKIVYPVRKDDTDLILALRYAVEQGCKKAVVLGCFGGRLDHTVGNLQSIAFGWKLGLHVTLMDARNRAFPVGTGTTVIPREKDCYISFFCFGENCEGITYQGLSYPLTNAVLKADYPLGVSNEFVEEEAVVSLKKGLLLCIISKK
jgi:thiamine pyrophosphokinase